MNRMVDRGLRILLLVALATASLAPAALAGHSHRHSRFRYGGPVFCGPRVVYVRHFRPVFIERHSDVGPAIAGFLGGLVLGSVLSDAQPAPPPPPVYEYYDPYCRERFASLDAYEEHLAYHGHPSVIDVLETRSGQCVDTYVWEDGGWRSGQDRDGDDGEGAE